MFITLAAAITAKRYKTLSKPKEQEILQFAAKLLSTLRLQVFGIIFTISQGKIIDRFGTLAGNIFLCVFLVIGTIMTGERSKTGATLLLSHCDLAAASDEKQQKFPKCCFLFRVWTKNLFYNARCKKFSVAGQPC